MPVRVSGKLAPMECDPVALDKEISDGNLQQCGTPGGLTALSHAHRPEVLTTTQKGPE
jgi:hypothetical protein